ncbi:MAG TPA: chemotaxis protein CheW [Polyangiaceae bacterium]|jgi:purine-binding chemotaxis protein CheW|nr:chemotaxis protein CheW [Polyangiaceae bacterium]
MADLLARGRNDRHRGIKVRGPRVEYLAFRLGADTYAVPIGEVREILKLPPVTEVPRAPEEIVGVVSVRGLLVTVISLRARLRLQATESSRKGRILLAMGAQDEVIGLYVDEVLQVYRLAESEIEVAASVLGGRLGDYIVGIGRPDGALLTLLDLRPILGRSEPVARDAT